MSTLTHWDRSPFADVMDGPGGPVTAARPGGPHPMRLETCRTDSEFVVRAELPGVEPEKDIEVTVSGRTLAIRAERRQDPAARCHSEFRYGSYARSIPLPATAGEERVRASYSHGVLEITVELQDDPGDIPRQIRVMVDHHIDPT